MTDTFSVIDWFNNTLKISHTTTGVSPRSGLQKLKMRVSHVWKGFCTSDVLPQAWHRINSISDETAVSALISTTQTTVNADMAAVKRKYMNEYLLHRHVTVKQIHLTVTLLWHGWLSLAPLIGLISCWLWTTMILTMWGFRWDLWQKKKKSWNWGLD